MPIAITCLSCLKRLNVPDDRAGSSIKCKCGNRISVPAPPAPTRLNSNTGRVYSILAFTCAFSSVAVIAFFVGRWSVAGLGEAATIAVASDQPPIAQASPPPVAKEDFSVKVTKAEAGDSFPRKSMFGGTSHQSGLACITIYFEMKNATANRKYDGGAWPTGQLTDEFGNQYRLISDDHAARPDRMPIILRPGESVRDVLVFEAPLPQAKMLTLELQDHFTSTTGPPRSSVAIKIPVASVANVEKMPPEKVAPPNP